jgi:hypothetical protein
MVAIILIYEVHRMPFYTTLKIDYDFDNPKLREMQQDIKQLASRHHGKFLNESDEWGELKLTFAFPCRIFLCNFLIKSTHEYPDAVVINVSKQEKIA